MAYYIKSSGELNLPSLRDVVLEGIFEFGHGKYTVEQTDPKIIWPEEDRDLYILGSVYRGRDMDRIFTYHVKSMDFSDSNFFLLLSQGLDFIPDWITLLGIESGDGFYDGILHKNLSSEDVFNARLLGERIREGVEGVEQLAFVHYSVDNREMVPCLDLCS